MWLWLLVFVQVSVLVPDVPSLMAQALASMRVFIPTVLRADYKPTWHTQRGSRGGGTERRNGEECQSITGIARVRLETGPEQQRQKPLRGKLAKNHNFHLKEKKEHRRASIQDNNLSTSSSLQTNP